MNKADHIERERVVSSQIHYVYTYAITYVYTHAYLASHFKVAERLKDPELTCKLAPKASVCCVI